MASRRRRSRAARVIALLGLVVTAAAVLEPQNAPATLTVVAAADLQGALTEISSNFEKASGVRVQLSFGSSGNLAAMIENGAPYDVFFSADVSYPRKLIADGAADPGSLYEYAVGRLVLWIANGVSADPTRGMDALLDPGIRKIAIANPRHAPYGQAAMAALQHFGLQDKVASRLVLGENATQAAQFVASGNAQAGLIPLSLALGPGMKGKGRHWEVAVDAYPPLRQAAVIIRNLPHKREAERFLAYVKSPAARAVFDRYGFGRPGGTP